MHNKFVLLLMTLPALAMGKEGLEDPIKAYQKGRYDKALEGFVDQQVEHPTNPRLFLNLGSAHYQMKNYPEAEKAFNQALLLGDDGIRQQATYNLGNTAFRLGKLDEAIDWYKRSLEIDPNDEDTKFNLEFVRDEIRRRHEEDQKRQAEQKKQPNQQCDRKPPEQQKQPDENQPEQQPQSDKNQSEQPTNEQQNQPQEPQPDRNEPDEPPQQPEQAAQAEPGRDEKDEKKDDQPATGGAQAKMQPMTPEEAERYLQALSEDRKKHLEKQRAKLGSRARPAKDW